MIKKHTNYYVLPSVIKVMEITKVRIIPRAEQARFDNRFVDRDWGEVAPEQRFPEEWFTPDSDYIWCADDETAIKEGKKLAEKGIDFPDFGHCNLTLIQIVEVDDDSECFNDKRVVWY